MRLLKDGQKSLLTSQKNVTVKNVESVAGDLAEKFTPSQLKTGAKFIRAIRDKSRKDDKPLFNTKGKSKSKYEALTDIAKSLDTGVIQKASQHYRTPQARYERKAVDALEKAHKSLDGKVMYELPSLYVVVIKYDKSKKESVLGGYASPSSARAAARAYMTGMKKAYDPLIAAAVQKTNKSGKEYTTKAKLKIESYLAGSGKGGEIYEKQMGSAGQRGEAMFRFEPNAAMKYLVNKMKKKSFKLRVIKVTDRKDHRSYWKLFDSPQVGTMVWNPKCM